MRHPILILLGLALAAGPADPAGAAEMNYAHCIDMAQIDPQQIRADAIAWYERTGDPAALHCQAIALSEIGALRSAALLLEEIAQLPGIDTLTRVDVLIQASAMWREERNLEAALAALTRARDFKETPALLVELAEVHGERQEWAAARESLDRALSVAPRDAKALALRAAARRRLGDPEGAKRDALQAIEYRPIDAGAWFELGKAEQELGFADAARRAWLKTIDLAPTGPYATLARGGLQDMDGGR